MSNNQQNPYDINTVMAKFKDSITRNLSVKKQQNMLEWLNTFSQYLDNEDKFDPLTDTLSYGPGAVLSIDLGFNAKSEHGGRHYAVVVENNNKSSNTVMIVPLGSEKQGKKVNWNDVDLGVIEEINDLTGQDGVKSIAKISHLRSISKMRIVQPVKQGNEIIYLDPKKLKLIYDKIRVRFTTKGLNRQGSGTIVKK
jgi:mRNA interferase MazF